MGSFQRYPGGILAHSTHVKGLGTFDASHGRETPRIRVTLATGIPAERCGRINLDYVDPATIDPADWPGPTMRTPSWCLARASCSSASGTPPDLSDESR